MNYTEDFLKLLDAKQVNDNTVRIAYAILVEKPELYRSALKYVYPYATDTPGDEAMDRMKEFINLNMRDSNNSGTTINESDVTNDNLFQLLFL